MRFGDKVEVGFHLLSPDEIGFLCDLYRQGDADMQMRAAQLATLQQALNDDGVRFAAAELEMNQTLPMEIIMPARIRFEGNDIAFASADDIAAGMAAAQAVFALRQADPLACAAANDKRNTHQLLDREDALHCVIWDEANYAAWHAMTQGWLRRDVDIHLALAATNVQ